MASLKVFGGVIFTSRGQRRAIVAATSQAKAAEALSISTSTLRKWWTQTFNELEVAMALAKPGQVLIASSALDCDFQSSVFIGGAWVRIE